jgi:23S rRNA (cytidine1920-2'-O)/16S rRNA (cytidine1409-2'-O)-methyltransferase
MPARRRLDAELVRRGLAVSRTEAQRLIAGGGVMVAGNPAARPATLVGPEAPITLAEGPAWASRAGGKLAAALDAFVIDPEGKDALDVGASTGGFTDVLLQRGAPRVVALDVGHGQLDWKLRTDPRVVVIERVNARTLTPDRLPPDARIFDVVTIDVSFISLRHILPVLPPLLADGADVVALVKPQFEAGRAEVGKGGIVRNDAVRARVVAEVAAAADALGLKRAGGTESPIEGMEGNKEYLLHLKSDACPPSRR